MAFLTEEDRRKINLMEADKGFPECFPGLFDDESDDRTEDLSD